MSTSIWSGRDGCIIHGTWPDILPIVARMGPYPLIVADPPYGRIVDQSWDHFVQVDDLLMWTQTLSEVSSPQGSMYWFGGAGKRCDRPFFQWVSEVESLQPWQIAMLITWAKRRAYGVQTNYLFTREEIAYCINGNMRKPRTFNVPYLDKERGYDGYNPDYPAKDKRLRRNAVWTDIIDEGDGATWEVTEVLRNKRHPCEKPRKLIDIMIETSSNPGDIVLDPFAGSGVTAKSCRALGRYFVLVEQDRETFEATCKTLDNG